MEVLIQLGPDFTSDSDVVRSLLERFGITDATPPRDDQVIEVISTLLRVAGEGTLICDVGAFIRAIISYVSGARDFSSCILKALVLGCPYQLARRHQGLRLARA